MNSTICYTVRSDATILLSCVQLCPPRNRDVSGVRLETTLAVSHVLAKRVASFRAAAREPGLHTSMYGLKLLSDSSVTLFRPRFGLICHKKATQEIIKSRLHCIYLYSFFIFLSTIRSRACFALYMIEVPYFQN
jgi:hypothetical protein